MPKDNTADTPKEVSASIGDNSNLDVDYKDLQAYLDELKDKAHGVAEATSSLRTRIKSIIEEKGYHKGALGMIRQIENMSQTARADFLRTFEPMFDAMVENKWRAESDDMLDREMHEANE